jgi:hypothetical protein
MKGEMVETIESPEFMDEVVPVKPGGTLFVRSSRGSIDVRSHDGDEVRVEAEARGRRAERVIFTLDTAGDDVRFAVRTEGWLLGVFGGLDVRARLWVPRRFSVAVRASGGDTRVDGITGDLELHASGGDVSVSGVVGRVDLQSSGGNVDMENIDGEVRVRCSGGNTEMRDVYGDVNLRSSGGDLLIDGVDGAVRSRSSGGSTSIVFLGDPEADVQSSGGSIDVLVREDASFALDAKSHGGKVEVELELDQERSKDSHRISGYRGSKKGAHLRLRSSGGGIRIGPI